MSLLLGVFCFTLFAVWRVLSRSLCGLFMIKASLLKFINSIGRVFLDGYAQVLMIAFSVMFGFAKSLSEFVYYRNEINIEPSEIKTYAILCYLLLNLAYWFILLKHRAKPIEIKNPKRLCFILFGIFLATYALCWITYWPGTIFVDNLWIPNLGMLMARQHPIFYCTYILFLFKIGMWLGGLHYSIILYTGVQILVTSAFMASLFFSIFQRKIPRWVKIILLVSCVALPIYAIFAIANVKDIYWSLCLSGFTVLIYRLLLSPEQKQSRKFWLLFNIYLLGIVLLRNNGIYITLFNLGFLLWLFPKQREMLYKSIGIILVAFCLLSLWYKLFDIEPMFKEKIAVPLQQIGAVVVNDGILTDEQKEFISKVMPLERIKKYYYPYTADTIKWGKTGFSSRFLNAHSFEFLRVWLDVVIANPKLSLLAYLQQVYWYWAPNNREQMWLVIDVAPELPFLCEELRTWIYEQGYVWGYLIYPSWQYRLSKYYETSYNFWHEGSLFWIVFGCALLYYLKQRSLKYLIIYLPVFSLWLTLMVAVPTHYFRYILSYIYLLPFFIALLFTDENEKGDKEVYIFDYKNWSIKTKKYLKWGTMGVGAMILVPMMYWGIVNNIPRSARVDIYTQTDEPMFNAYLNGHGVPLKETSWMPKKGNHGVAIRKYGNSMKVLLYVFENTNINVDLMGPSVRDKNGKRIEKWVKFTDFRINGRRVISNKETLEGNKSVWHDEPYKYTFYAEKDNVYEIVLKWRKN